MDVDLLEAEDLYLAGRSAPPGRYARVEPSDGRVLILESGQVLPASFDGRVAVYQRLAPAPTLKVIAAPRSRSKRAAQAD